MRKASLFVSNLVASHASNLLANRFPLSTKAIYSTAHIRNSCDLRYSRHLKISDGFKVFLLEGFFSPKQTYKGNLLIKRLGV